jgi:16S rRNA (guanine527-N7)-methyltransferase
MKEGLFMPIRPNEALLEDMLSILKLDITLSQRKKLLQYSELLLEGLKRQRLIGEKTAEGIIGKQFYDSLYPLKFISFFPGSKVLDLGSGAGLPGMPIKICLPGIYIFLLDANQRKMGFLKLAADVLELDKIEFLTGRSEEWAHHSGHREQYDYVLSKAVAESAVLAELALPMLKVGGQALLYKGSKGDQEAERAGNAIAVCGGEIEKVWRYNLPTGEKRSLFLLRKVKSTPLKYPRAAGKPAQKPIR